LALALTGAWALFWLAFWDGFGAGKYRTTALPGAKLADTLSLFQVATLPGLTP
jgi:hypothetical protein